MLIRIVLSGQSLRLAPGIIHGESVPPFPIDSPYSGREDGQHGNQNPTMAHAVAMGPKVGRTHCSEEKDGCFKEHARRGRSSAVGVLHLWQRGDLLHHRRRRPAIADGETAFLRGTPEAKSG